MVNLLKKTNTDHDHSELAADLTQNVDDIEEIELENI